MFKNNNAGVHLMTGVHSSHEYNGRTFVIPVNTGTVVEYNRFTNNAKFGFAMCNLDKDSNNKEGALTSAGAFNSITPANTATLSAPKNWWGAAAVPSMAASSQVTTTGHMTSADDDCIGPLSVWNGQDGTNSACLKGRMNCDGDKLADMKYRKCVSSCGSNQ
jgi:hypothetical protein